MLLRAYDKAGNYSDERARVLLDREPPAPFVPEVVPLLWSSADSVLIFSTTDASSGVERYELSVEGGPFARASSPYSLPRLPDGRHTVTVRAFDRAGNFADGTAEVLLDTTPPRNVTVKINKGAERTSSRALRLSISALDEASGLDSMCFSNDGLNYSKWEPFATSKLWTLAGCEGDRTVHTKVRDRAGNEATVASSINYQPAQDDRLPMTITVIIVM